MSTSSVDLRALSAACNLSDAVDRLMLADEYDAAGWSLHAAYLRDASIPMWFPPGSEFPDADVRPLEAALRTDPNDRATRSIVVRLSELIALHEDDAILQADAVKFLTVQRELLKHDLYATLDPEDEQAFLDDYRAWIGEPLNEWEPGEVTVVVRWDADLMVFYSFVEDHREGTGSGSDTAYVMTRTYGFEMPRLRHRAGLEPYPRD